jgi:hypothetical protein
MTKEKCPSCGEEFDPSTDEIVECPRCGKEGCTAYCCPGGNNCLCVECEGKGDEKEEDHGGAED